MKIFKDGKGRMRCVVDLPGDKRKQLCLYGDKSKSENDQIEDFKARLIERNLLEPELY